MNQLLENYRKVYEQGFMPIFVDDGFDTLMLVEACVSAGFEAIEYTLRRKDANTMIPLIKERYPDLAILVGSTLDENGVIERMRNRHPQLLTLDELESIGVDGFVSQLSWSSDSIREYSPRKIVIPSARTTNEAYLQVSAGAHFIKLFGNNLELVEQCRSEASFDYCPIFVSGGMNPERIPLAVEAGGVLTSAGFDVIIKDDVADATVESVAESLKQHQRATLESRALKWPAVSPTAETNDWLRSLPHHHPFPVD
jgi:2-keto-3-deoxy-6-phosphogluconate aldolase